MEKLKKGDRVLWKRASGGLWINGRAYAVESDPEFAAGRTRFDVATEKDRHVSTHIDDDKGGEDFCWRRIPGEAALLEVPAVVEAPKRVESIPEFAAGRIRFEVETETYGLVSPLIYDEEEMRADMVRSPLGACDIRCAFGCPCRRPGCKEAVRADAQERAFTTFMSTTRWSLPKRAIDRAAPDPLAAMLGTPGVCAMRGRRL